MLPSQIAHYLSSSNSHNMIKEAHERIADKVNRIEGLILGRAELDKLPIPITPTPPPIPEWGQPRIDRKKYLFVPYTYISYQHQAIQKHCREEHGWVNTRKRGRQQVSYEISILWISVYYQQFFPKGSGSAFFEVQATGSYPAILSGDIDLEAIKKRLNQEI
ncbi:helicase TLH3 protein [Rutstroemia sp. NJR-2017a WRK4]|nr:helicase TLH3 protein [Rutstroemia sp. NJR-2017a WRK4]